MNLNNFGEAWEYRPLIQIALLVIGIAYAFLRGAQPERAVAWTFLGMAIANVLLIVLFAHPRPLFLYFLLDAVAAIAFVGIGLFANRVYTLWIGSFQIIALSAHLIRLLAGTEDLTLPFAILYILPSYFQIGLFLWGTHCHARRVNRFGPYRSWRNFSDLY